MIKVRFHKADGTLDKEVEAKPGSRLLDVAWAAKQPLEGACEGVMACSTCHVIVDKADFEKLPKASDEEEDLLDLAAHATRTSRLACQIILTKDSCRREELALRLSLPESRQATICAAGVGRTRLSPTWSDPEGSSHNDFVSGRSGSHLQPLARTLQHP